MKTLIVVPTYNEVENIGPLLEALRDQYRDLDILVVDDSSPDGTADAVAAYRRRDRQVHLLRRAAKLGLGPAYRAGFTWGLNRGYDRLVEMDADGSHRPADLAALLQESLSADLVLGSRWIDGGAVVNWPWYRRLVSRGGTGYARRMLGLGLRDLTSGFRVYTRYALESIDLTEVASQGYCFQIDMARRAVAAGLTVSEVPITFVERTHGRSKMSGAIVREALWRVTLWGIARPLRMRRTST